MTGTWFHFCRVIALLLILAGALAAGAQSADAGILERVKSGTDYVHDLVGGGIDLFKEGMLHEPGLGDFDRRTSGFMGRQEREGIKTFAEIVADGKAKLSTGWKGWKGKLADTLLGKAASAVKEKLWDAVSSGQRRTETKRAQRTDSRATAAREAWKPWENESSVDEETDSARTLAEIAADGEVPDFVEPDISEEAGTGGAGEIDPLIALDIDEDEQDWYRSETGILDEAPLPEVRFAAVADEADRRDPNEISVYPPDNTEGVCESIWDDCPDDTYWSEEQQEGAGRLDEWVEFDEPQDAGEVYPDGDDWRYEAGRSLDRGTSALGDDDWKPWADETAEDGGQVAESDHGLNDCDDVWADCPIAMDWGEEQQAETGRLNQWAEYDQPQDDGAPQWQGDDWGYESEGSFDAIDDGEGGTYDARADYERALGDVLNEDGSSLADLNPEVERDYQMALKELEWQVAEKARIEAEKAEARAAEERRRLEAAKREQEAKERARIEAEKAKARAAEERRRREAAKRKQEAEERRSRVGSASGSGGAEGADDGSCGSSPPACDKYVRHGEQVQAQVSNVSHGSMTDAALLAAFVARLTLGCLKKCLPYNSSRSCKNAFQSAISEVDIMYRSAIESAKGSAADYSYVDEFDRNPGSSRFVRSLGISIVGTSLDSCGD